MKYRLIFFILFCLGVSGVVSCAHVAQPQITLIPSSGNKNGLVLTISLPMGAYMYGPQKQDEGYPPEIKWDTQENVVDIHAFWPGEKTFTLSGETVVGYKDVVHVPLTLTLKNPLDPVSLKGSISFLMCDQLCVPITKKIIYQGPIKTTEEYLVKSKSQEESFLKMLFFALLGGLLLNIMPCVLPALSLKIFSLLNMKQGNFKEIPKHLLVTIFGTFVFFMGFAFVIHVIRHLGTKIGWGFHFQEPMFIAFLCIVLTLFVLSLWNFLHLHLPFNFSWYSRKNSYPYTRDFLEGLFTALLSTPCTAPFLGAATGFAILKGGIYIYGVFIALWLGFSAPLLALAIYPKGVHLLPKPGKWMQHIQYILGFFMFLSILWLLWTLGTQVYPLAFCGIISLLLLIPFIFKIVRKPFQKTTFGALVMLILTTAFYGHKTSEHREISIEAILAEANTKGQKVFIEITASWCLTCHANQPLLQSPEVIKAFKKHKVHHITVDWTGRQKDVLNFMETHSRVGVPFYAVFDPKIGHVTVLPEVLTLSALLKVISESS